MFKYVGLFFLFIGLILTYKGTKNALRVLEYRMRTETTTAKVTHIRPYTTYSKWGDVAQQEVVFTYQRNGNTVVDTIKSQYAANRHYRRSFGKQAVGDKLTVRYPKEELFFSNRFENNDHKEVTEDGAFTENIFRESISLIIGLGFSFIGFVFYKFFASGAFKEEKPEN